MCWIQQHRFWLLGLLLCWSSVGCTQLDMRDDEEPSDRLRLDKAVRYTHWVSKQDDAPELYFYGKGKGRLVQVAQGKSVPFTWEAQPNGRSLELQFQDKNYLPSTLAVGESYKSLSYRFQMYHRQAHLRPLAVLIQAGEITQGLVVDAVIIIVVLVVGTNLILLLNRLDTRLKRHIRVRGSDMGYYLRTEQPELVSINGNPPITYSMKGHLLDVGGITCDIDTAELLEESETPLFQLRSGTQLRFYANADAYYKAHS